MRHYSGNGVKWEPTLWLLKPGLLPSQTPSAMNLSTENCHSYVILPRLGCTKLFIGPWSTVEFIIFSEVFKREICTFVLKKRTSYLQSMDKFWQSAWHVHRLCAEGKADHFLGIIILIVLFGSVFSSPCFLSVGQLIFLLFQRKCAEWQIPGWSLDWHFMLG